MTADRNEIVAVDPLDGGAAGKSGTSAPTERPGDSPRPGRSLPWDTDDSDDDEDRWQAALSPTGKRSYSRKEAARRAEVRRAHYEQQGQVTP